MTPELQSTLQRVSQARSTYDDAIYLLSQLRQTRIFSWAEGAIVGGMLTAIIAWLCWSPL